MRIAKQIGIGIVCALISKISFTQQLRLGKNPYTVEKSAVLELVSDNQGLLLPRISDTSSINSLTPPDGMIIYYSPSNQLLIRSNGHWKAAAETGSVVTSLNGNAGALTMDTSYISNFYSKVRSLFSGTGPINYSNGTISITQASSSSDGYLSSADWNTFNNKANSFSTGNLTEAGSSILTITGGTNSVVGSGTSIQVKQANTSQSGFLSNTDWNTFNNKLSSVDTSNISNFYLKIRGLLSAGTGISYNNSTGVISNSGVVSLNGNTGALTMDTTYISNFYLKVRALHSVSAPLTYNSTTGAIAITQAGSSSNGYLSNTDWNTFNNKLSSVDTSNISNFYSKVRGLFSGTAPITYSNGTISITQAGTSSNGYLSSTDWNTFNNKQGSGNYLVDPGGNGILARTALNTTINRTITGTSNRISITNGDGISGNPTIDISSSYIGQNTITTLGTVTTGTWQGTVVDELYGGTGLSSYATGDILYASAANTLSKLPIGTGASIGSPAQVLVAGTTPSWADNTGAWTEYQVSSSDYTTTSTSLGNVTGLVTGTLAISSVYEFEAVLLTSCSGTGGSKFGTNLTVAPTNTTAIYQGMTAAGTGAVSATTANNTADGTAFATVGSSTLYCIKITGIFTTASSGSPVFSIRAISVTSGQTTTVKVGSILRIRKL